MCTTRNGYEWIISLDGRLKRCPDCSTPYQIDWVEREARLHALRLGVDDGDTHDTSNADHDETDDIDAEVDGGDTRISYDAAGAVAA